MNTMFKSILLASAISVSAIACAKEEPKKEPEVKTVCIDKITKDGKPVIDPKTKKPQQDCKKIKVHKKLDGTKVPEKKK